MAAVNEADFVAPREATRQAFMALAEPFYDRLTGDFDLDGLKDAFDGKIGAAALEIQQMVFAAGGSDQDVEWAISTFLQSVQAAFRRIQ